MISRRIALFLRKQWNEQKKRRANAELENSMARRLEECGHYHDAKGRYTRTGGRARCERLKQQQNV